MTSFVQRLLQSGDLPAYLLTARRGDAVYHYVIQTTQPQLQALLAAEDDTVDITRYARILSSGPNVEPSREEIEYLALMHEIQYEAVN